MEIVVTIGISVRQLYNWKRHPTFRARVEELLTAPRAQLDAERAVETERMLDRMYPARSRRRRRARGPRSNGTGTYAQEQPNLATTSWAHACRHRWQKNLLLP